MNIVKKIVAKIASEPAVTLGVVIAAVNSVTVNSWTAYAAAVATALLRFAVSPAVKA